MGHTLKHGILDLANSPNDNDARNDERPQRLDDLASIFCRLYINWEVTYRSWVCFETEHGASLWCMCRRTMSYEGTAERAGISRRFGEGQDCGIAFTCVYPYLVRLAMHACVQINVNIPGSGTSSVHAKLGIRVIW